MLFSAESELHQQVPGRTAIVLVNLGTPASPRPGDVRRFLREFLSDPRVVEIPRLLWWPILYGVVLPLRPRKTADKYAAIWTERGSPLLVESRQQAQLLRGYLGERGIDVDVWLAMRYGEPSLASVVRQLQKSNAERVLLLPLYPQYSASTTATVFDAFGDALKSLRSVPEVRWVRHFHDDAGYIDALKRSVLDHWTRFGRLARGERLVISFHGVPKRTLLQGDPYHCECRKTGRLLAEALDLGSDEYLVTFQSRFGRAEWLQPYTSPTLQQLAADGAARVDVICPGFTADCLETLEEIAIEGRREFLAAGGKELRYIRCLNDAPAFIAALADLACRHMQGWPIARKDELARESEARDLRERVRLLGTG